MADILIRIFMFMFILEIHVHTASSSWTGFDIKTLQASGRELDSFLFLLFVQQLVEDREIHHKIVLLHVLHMNKLQPVIRTDSSLSFTPTFDLRANCTGAAFTARPQNSPVFPPPLPPASLW